jgi:hypothetical protein
MHRGDRFAWVIYDGQIGAIDIGVFIDFLLHKQPSVIGPFDRFQLRKSLFIWPSQNNTKTIEEEKEKYIRLCKEENAKKKKYIRLWNRLMLCTARLSIHSFASLFDLGFSKPGSSGSIWICNESEQTKQ